MRIIVFGDSITWGACDNEAGGWVTRLRNKFAADDISFYNCGISGDNSDDLVIRFQVEAESRKDDDGTTIIFAIGINDSQYTGDRTNTRVSQEKFLANLETLIKQAQQVTNSILFVGLNRVEDAKLTPIPWGDENKNYDNENVSLYNELIRKAAEKEKLPFLDISSTLDVGDLEDGLHPNSTGHQKMAEEIEKFLREEGVLK